jgi:hypothetical protein
MSLRYPRWLLQINFFCLLVNFFFRASFLQGVLPSGLSMLHLQDGASPHFKPLNLKSLYYSLMSDTTFNYSVRLKESKLSQRGGVCNTPTENTWLDFPPRKQTIDSVELRHNKSDIKNPGFTHHCFICDAKYFYHHNVSPRVYI